MICSHLSNIPTAAYAVQNINSGCVYAFEGQATEHVSVQPLFLGYLYFLPFKRARFIRHVFYEAVHLDHSYFFNGVASLICRALRIWGRIYDYSEGKNALYDC
jgi:hypothetical protein